MIDTIRQWFDQYTGSFYTDNPQDNRNITLKSEHCKRVSAICADIACHEGFSRADCRLGEMIGLLHDIGRFEQYRQFKTFADHKSVNHGRLGEQVLKETACLKHLSDDDRTAIYSAVVHHNQPCLPAAENERRLKLIKLVRDADKVDIFELSSNYFRTRTAANKNTTLELHVHEGSAVSDKIFQQIMDGFLARMEDIETLNDFKVLQMSWIFDINFTRTFTLVNANRVLSNLRSTIADSSPRVELIYQKTQAFLDQHIQDAHRTKTLAAAV